MLLIFSIILIGSMVGMRVVALGMIERHRKEGLYVYCPKYSGEIRRGNSAPFCSKCNLFFLVKNDSRDEFELLKKLCEDTQSFFVYFIFFRFTL
ncbi:hypothetical protein [Bacillus cereus group sp. BfR-BA-01383]|uniref:hypothetical protein n=1 Tax=Bacillus cereus group sp. BfR-BA-01383 TaxID=2920327 RepID=UPI001F56F8D8|nr:hypothetical protein [Bacillus cereus group sp. BfR-BA-01383]